MQVSAGRKIKGYFSRKELSKLCFVVESINLFTCCIDIKLLFAIKFKINSEINKEVINKLSKNKIINKYETYLLSKL